MLFRAPGVSETQQSSTLVEVNQASRAAREKGFELAMQDMSGNLALELDQFKEKIKQDKSVQVAHRQGYGGGGSMQWPVLLVLMLLAVFRACRR